MRTLLCGVVGVALGLATAFGQPERPCPVPAPRVAAEWEPVVGVVIGWPLELPRALVCAMARDVDLHVTVQNESARVRAARTFADWGIDPARLRFILTPQGSGYYLPRDWGPFAVFDATGKYRLIDGQLRDYFLGDIGGRRVVSLSRLFRLNYQRDDQAPAALARTLGVERTELPLCLTGGNVAFDGHGTGFATQLLLDENIAMGVSREQFLCLLKQHLGVSTFHFVPNFERLGIQHIDCLFKLLDEERMLVKRAPADHPVYPHIENVVRHLASLTNVHGRPYEILRIDTPRYFFNKMAGYTNALIVNRKVYVPLFGIAGDEAALETWRQAMPGHEVLGFAHENWSFTDALHCRVRGVWDPKMLYLSHERPLCRIAWAKSINLDVQIRDYSGAGLLADQLTLSWRTRGECPWHVVPLQLVGANTFRAILTSIAPGQTVEYHFSAASASGRRETLPRTAPHAVVVVTIGSPR